MVRSQLGLAISASLFYLYAPASAAQNESQQQDIERVVVTATRTEQPWLTTPASIDRVEVNEQLSGLRVDMAEVLAGIPGVQVDTRYNFAQDTRVILRGFGARAAFGVRGVVMRLDGVPLSMPDGQAQTSSIFIDEPSHVEVLRGPVAAVYGNAAGGVINLQSQLADQSYISAGHSIGANGRERRTLDGAYVADQLTLAGHYARFRTDGDRAQAAAERDQYALRGAYQFGHNIELIARIDDNDAPLLQDPGSLTPEQWRDDPEQTFAGASVFDTRKTIRHRQQSLTLRQTQATYDWELATWNGRREVVQFLPFPGSEITSSGAVIDLTRDFYGLHGQFNWRPSAFEGRWQLSLGTDIERQEDTRLGFVNQNGQPGDLRRDETGRVDKDDVYALSQLDITERLSWLAGVRISELSFDVRDRYIIEGIVPDDSGSNRYRETSWTQGLSYQLNQQWSVFAAFGEGFETPTLTELAYRNDGSGLNPDLGPAFVTQYEAGIKWLGPQGQLQMSVFAVDTDDEIVVDQSIDGRTTYRNAGETERRGVEISSRWLLHPQFDLRAAASIMNARYRDIDGVSGNRIPGVANTNAFAQLNFLPWQDERLRASVTAQYRSQVAANDSNDVFAPGFTLWHAGLDAMQNVQAWQFSQWIRVDNLLDKQYVGSVVVNQGSGRAFEPAPGRQLSAGLRVTRRF
ncbi:MAG: TonB-dependent receptor [Firmicutes bacterium]|nr:TonB-dependent receptor [Bacillota bacterium]